MNVQVYKTNITKKTQAKEVMKIIRKEYQLEEINFDLEDIDNILRVVSPEDIGKEIAKSVRNMGYQCEELS